MLASHTRNENFMQLSDELQETNMWNFIKGKSKYVPLYSAILSVLVPRKCEYLKNYSLDFEHAYTTTYLAS